jgi:hypothetical protein
VPPSDADVEGFIRTTEAHWFDVSGVGQSRRGVYANLLQGDARRQGWNWQDIESQLEAVIERHGGLSRPQKHKTLLDIFRHRGWRQTTYYELPADYFRR